MIGIFDSGLGGVTVLKRLLEILPNENYFYYSDSIHNPYGEKKEEVINSYAEEIIDYLLKKGCKCIIIACNTVSTVSVKYLRKKYPNIMIFATVPAIKMAYDYSYYKKTLVMATRRTLESDLWQELYNKYHPKNTKTIICDGLAKLIEDDKEKEIKKYLKEKLSNYSPETVILGCTHYPLIKKK